jgi:glutaredoxin 3
MSTKRSIEIFSARCPACEETVTLVNQLACPSCDITVVDMKDPKAASRAKSLGVGSVPAVVINGTLADCCAGRARIQRTLWAAGLEQPLP